jgi:signal transduction histidine kinase
MSLTMQRDDLQTALAAFDRFWRASTKRTALGGSGLGLAIARKLVVVDHGTIHLDASSPEGIDAVITYKRVVL